MYLPRHFTVTDLEAIAAFVDASGAADLVTFDGSKPVATRLPVIWDRPPGFPDPAGEGEPDQGYGRLVGHLALANPQWQSARPGALGLAIVPGPQAYVSPSWYESKARHGRVVPTWNYQAVHLTGPVSVHQDPEWLRALVTRLTQRHEAAQARPWAVTDAPPEYVDGQLKAIVGVEMTITAVEAKDKLSQNRSVPDRVGVVAGLRRQPGAEAAAIADRMAVSIEAASIEAASIEAANVGAGTTGSGRRARG
jgi:transcriptional regulator